MSADLLRRAAAKIRETAQGASPGPWSKHEAGDGTVSVVGPDVHFLAEVGAAVFPSVQRDAEHIVLWSPDVAELVALVLEGTAGGLERRGVTARHTFAEQSALALARRIIGEDA